MTKSINTLLMQHSTLHTERLTLRPFTMADAADMFAYASDATQTAFVFPTHESLAETEQVLAERFVAQPKGKYAIVYQEHVIGSIDLRVDTDNLTAEIGYILHADYEGYGYATEAAKAIIHFAFDTLHLNEIHAYYDTENEASLRLMKRVGMVYRGTLPAFKMHRGKPVDIGICSITKTAYEQ